MQHVGHRHRVRAAGFSRVDQMLNRTHSPAGNDRDRNGLATSFVLSLRLEALVGGGDGGG